jgi:hypothetical protein
LQASRASDTETLQSQVNKAAKKRLSLSGLEILHGRLILTVCLQTLSNCPKHTPNRKFRRFSRYDDYPQDLPLAKSHWGDNPSGAAQLSISEFFVRKTLIGVFVWSLQSAVTSTDRTEH